MNEGRCATCRWWWERATRSEGEPGWRPHPDEVTAEGLVPDYAHYARYEYADDAPAPEGFPVRYCASPRLRAFERPGSPQGASVVDGSRYKAVLVTGPDFGCVNWAAQDDTEQESAA
jgi:hypothetical protein